MSDLRYATPPPEAVASSSSLSRTASPSHAAASSSSVPRAVHYASREADEQDGSSRSSTGWSRKRAWRDADEEIDAPADASHRQCLDRARSYLEQAQERDDELRRGYAEQVIRKERSARDRTAKASSFEFDFDSVNAPFHERESWKLAERMRMPAKLDPVAVKLRKESLRWARSALLLQEDAESYYRAAAAFKALAEPAKALSALERARRFDDGAWASAIDQLEVRCSSRFAAALLPVELFVPIFGELGAVYSARALRVCRSWHSIMSRPEFWRKVVFAPCSKARKAVPKRTLKQIASRSDHSITELESRSLETKELDYLCSVLARSALSIRSIVVDAPNAAYDFLRLAEQCPKLSILEVHEIAHGRRRRPLFDPSQGPLVKRGLTRVSLELDAESCVGRFNEGLLQLIEQAAFARLSFCGELVEQGEGDDFHYQERWIEQKLCTIDWLLAAFDRCQRLETFSLQAQLPWFEVRSPFADAGPKLAPHLRHLYLEDSIANCDAPVCVLPEHTACLSAPLLETLECDAALLSIFSPVSFSRPISLTLTVAKYCDLDVVARGDHAMNLTVIEERDADVIARKMLDDPTYCRNVRKLNVSLWESSPRWSVWVRLIAARLYGSQPGATLDEYLAIGRHSTQAPSPRETTAQSGPFQRGSRVAVEEPAIALPQERKPLAADSSLPPLCSAIQRFELSICADEYLPEEALNWFRANTSFELNG